MFTRSHNKEEVKLWRIIFDLRETIASMSQQIDRYVIRQNKVINMHQPYQWEKVCVNCDQPYPCQTINALK